MKAKLLRLRPQGRPPQIQRDIPKHKRVPVTAESPRSPPWRGGGAPRVAGEEPPPARAKAGRPAKNMAEQRLQSAGEREGRLCVRNLHVNQRDVLPCARSHRGHAAATGSMFPLVYLLQTFKPFCFMILSRCLEVLDSRPCFVSVQAIAKSQTRAGASTNKCRTRVRDTEPEAEHGHTAIARLAAKKVAAGPNKRHD